MKNLIPKGFAWAVVDEKGYIICDSEGLVILSTKKEAKSCLEVCGGRVVKVKMEIIK